eukprot:jgi/Tetstr1/433646/TSEL_000014.t2
MAPLALQISRPFVRPAATAALRGRARGRPLRASAGGVNGSGRAEPPSAERLLAAPVRKGVEREERVSGAREAVDEGAEGAAEARKSGRARQLNRRLRGAERYSVVLNLVRRHVQEFDSINCATAMSRLGHLSASMSGSERQVLHSSSELTLLLAFIENSMWDFQPQAMANTVWALGRLQYYPGPQFLEVLTDRTLWCLNDFKPQEMASLVWGLAGLSAGSTSPRPDGRVDWDSPGAGVLVELLSSVCEQATTNVVEFRAKELCQMMVGLGRLEFYHPYFMEAMSESVQHRVTACNDQDVCNIASACAALRFYDEPLLQHVDKLASAIVGRMSPLACTTLLMSFAKLGFVAGRSAPLLAGRLAARPGDMSQQALCNALWALGVLQAADVHVVRALGMELEQRLQGGGQHRAVDYSQVFHAGMMMDLQWKAGNVRTVMGLSAQTWARMSRAWMDVVRQQSRQESEMRAQVGECWDMLNVPYGANQPTRDKLMCVGIAVLADGKQVALEVESTDHYAVNGRHRAVGERLVRRQLLRVGARLESGSGQCPQVEQAQLTVEEGKALRQGSVRMEVPSRGRE